MAGRTRGPRKKTLKELSAGSRRRKDRARETAAVAARVPPGAPLKPRWLSAAAAAEWERMIGLLGAVVARADADALARYCDTLCRWRQCLKVLDAEGMTYDMETKTATMTYARPEVAIAKGLAGQLKQLEQEFGLTPAARGPIVAPPPDDPESKKFFKD